MSGPNGKPRLASKTSTGGPGDPVVFVADEQDAVTLDALRWMRLAQGVLASEGVRGHCELNVLFVSERDMAEFNAEHMGKAGPTDVLSFPIDAEELGLQPGFDPLRSGPDRAPIDEDDLPLLLGDVVICPSVAERQAPTHAGNLDDELALLVVHGILHVLGHDHAEAEERERMWARERALLTSLHWQGDVPSGFMQDQVDN
jgi:probable rRNA maturation factor